MDRFRNRDVRGADFPTFFTRKQPGGAEGFTVQNKSMCPRFEGTVVGFRSQGFGSPVKTGGFVRRGFFHGWTRKLPGSMVLGSQSKLSIFCSGFKTGLLDSWSKPSK